MRALLPSTLLALAATLPAQDLLVRAKTVVVAPDTVLTDGRFLVRDGKIAYVGSDVPADAAAKATVVDCGDAVVVPGFVLAPTTLGRDGDLAEGALPFTPDLRAAEAFDPWQDELAKLPRAGFTAAVLAPSPRNLAGGLGALVKPGASGGRVATADLHLALSLTAAARNPERPPTSLMGGVDLLRSAFAQAKSAAAPGPDVAVLRDVLQGGRKVAIAADTLVELQAALDLARDFGFEPVLVGARDADKALPRLVAQRAAVVLAPLAPEMRRAQLELPARFAEAGVPFCFSGNPEQTRLSAVLAVRHGLDRQTAWAALGRATATMFGAAGQVGALRQGCAADFAVWSGDPLDLGSSLRAVYVDGARVHGGQPSAAAPAASSTAAGGR
jgi:imidazolonepropionase-like amidohydrolase